MTTTIKICYNNFINSLIESTGLPISQMQTISEWVENRLRKINFFVDGLTDNQIAYNFGTKL